ncbi:MAG: NAD(P)H-hydrate dehydratase [Chitinophagaceae bacterium]|nr:NAD(P)H-hydrate dehydratase [Chitinophagaceae bacterium]
MKIFSAAQLKQWDVFTIANEPITSIDLMERAATACYNWLIGKNFGTLHFRIFCGKGNNGGDGLAIARMLIEHKCLVTVYILEFGNLGTEDFQTNLERLHPLTTDIHFIQSKEFFPELNDSDIVIDALFGTGLNKPPESISAALINQLNLYKKTVISIDLPSGLFADTSSKGNAIVKATHTLSFQNYKLAFLLPENENYGGEIHLLHIGRHRAFEENEPADFELTDEAIIKAVYKPRSAFAHKGTYGHAALLCGSNGMMGAAVLSSLACLRSGVGKLTTYIPQCGYQVLQTTVPEAMCFVAGEDHLLSAPGSEKMNAVGIGPGIGLHPSHKKLIADIFEKVKTPMVIDADALNIMAENRALLSLVPKNSILTPHPKEFERLFGKTENDFDRLKLAKQKSTEYQVYIILKGHYSFISTPEGKGYFNSTGNAGMATAGSGDVLTGMITGLLAQHYTPINACLLAVYLHGVAGDIAAAKCSEEAMIATDLINCMGDAFIQIQTSFT